VFVCVRERETRVWDSSIKAAGYFGWVV